MKETGCTDTLPPEQDREDPLEGSSKDYVVQGMEVESLMEDEAIDPDEPPPKRQRPESGRVVNVKKVRNLIFKRLLH